MINWCSYNTHIHGDWNEKLKLLSGANFFQTLDWAKIKSASGWHSLNLLAISDDSIVAMAAVLFRRQPFAGAVVWVPGGVCGSPTVWAREFRSAVKVALGVQWVYIRVNIIGLEASEEMALALCGAGWSRPRVKLGSGLTLAYDLNGEESARLDGLTANWRHNLKRSRKYESTFTEWRTPDVSKIKEIYSAMEGYKDIAAQVSNTELTAIISELKNSLIIFKCQNSAGEIIAIRGCVVFADQAFDLLAAAAPSARKVYASYGLFWELLNHCHEKGVARYDLGGVDPIGNKGVYNFKHGLGSVHYEYVGEWESASPRIIGLLFNLFYKLKTKTKVKHAVKKEDK